MHEFTYRDGRYYRDGKPLFVVAAEYHFHRDKREHWKDRLEKLKASGANTIDFYIPWRHHMLIQDDHRVYDFTGKTKDSRDVVTWMKTIESLGLYMIVKPGPFIHSELNIGGLPDVVSPTYSPGVPAQRRHHGRMAYWGYDATPCLRRWMRTSTRFAKNGSKKFAPSSVLSCATGDPSSESK